LKKITVVIYYITDYVIHILKIKEDYSLKNRSVKIIMALALSMTTIFSAAACGAKDTANKQQEESSELETETAVTQTEVAEEIVPKEEASIDFEDGLYGFVRIDKTLNPVCDNSIISIADYENSKALKVEGQGKPIYIGVQIDKLLGDRISEVRSIEMTLGMENPDGQFSAVSGRIYGFVGNNNTKISQDWAIYLEDVNPKKITYQIEDWATLQEGNYLVISLETDTAMDKGATPAILYIDDISFKNDVDELIEADTTFTYEDDGESDRDGLYELTDTVEFEGFATSGDAWSQSGFTMPDEILAALVPGSVVEIAYTSDSGDIWLVMSEAEVGWSRVGQGNADGSGSDSAVFNGTICQVTYEQIAAVCGDDVSTWGSVMQCESSGAWEVFGISVGNRED
jgi:hypothetical protein